MSTRQRRHRRPTRLAAGTLVTAALLLSGCSAGQQAQSSSQVPPIPGVDADAGPIALRELLVPYRARGYPAGSDVPLVVRLYSTAAQPVRLRQVTVGPTTTLSVGARSIVLHTAAGGPATVTVQPEDSVSLVPPDGDYLVAEHITGPFGYGRSLPVRFTFSSGDSARVDIPMAPPDYPLT